MLGEALRLTRVFHDLKVTELAGELGLSPSFISEIEKGDKQPSMDTLQKYATYFDTKVSALMFFSEDLEKSKVRSPKKYIRNALIKFLQVVENGTA